jgi:hypothetical protein
MAVPNREERDAARRGFFLHLRYYIAVNLFVFLLYEFAEGHGLWPLFIALFWGLFLAGHFYRSFLRKRD